MKKHPLPEKTRENIRTALCRDTREGFLHELAGKGIVPVLWENGAGVIYGVTYIDHNTRAVFKGSALGKEFSASVINRKYGTPPARPRQAGSRTGTTRKYGHKGDGACGRPTGYLLHGILSLPG